MTSPTTNDERISDMRPARDWKVPGSWPLPGTAIFSQDRRVLAGAASIVIAVLLARYIPSLCASRVNPIVALRNE